VRHSEPEAPAEERIGYRWTIFHVEPHDIHRAP